LRKDAPFPDHRSFSLADFCVFVYYFRPDEPGKSTWRNGRDVLTEGAQNKFFSCGDLFFGSGSGEPEEPGLETFQRSFKAIRIVD